jgi:hypothetical protein
MKQTRIRHGKWRWPMRREGMMLVLVLMVLMVLK